MAYTTVFKHEVVGLKEFHKYLSALGVPDQAISEAMNAAGQPLAAEIVRIAPKSSGKMAGTVKVNKAKSELRITVGNNTTTKYAYNFHAMKLGKSTGYFTVKQHSRAGNLYNRTFALRNYPFAYIAAQAKQQLVLDSYLKALDAIAARNPPGVVT